MPSTNSSSRPKVWPSSTLTTPSLPTFSIASEMTSPISRAIVTPSFVIVGAPNFLSSTTYRPLGPRVTLTASASWLTPRSSARRASSLKSSSLCAIGSVSLLDSRAVADDLRQDVRLAQDQVLVGADLDLGAAVLGEDDLVTLLQVHLDELAVLVARAGAHGEDAAALRLLLGRVRQHDAARRDLL